MIQDLFSWWIESDPVKIQKSTETVKSLQRSMPPSVTLRGIQTDQFVEVHRSMRRTRLDPQTYGIAERAVRRVKEGNFAALVRGACRKNGGARQRNAIATNETCIML